MTSTLSGRRESSPTPRRYDSGETPDVSALLDQMREQASQPTQTEQNTANIDYLLMTVGGDQ